jgi:hypothetical protein
MILAYEELEDHFRGLGAAAISAVQLLNDADEQGDSIKRMSTLFISSERTRSTT